MSKYVYKWKYWFAWYPVKDVNGERVWLKTVVTNGSVYVQFTGKRNKGISIMVPLDHMEGEQYTSQIERKK